jgi:predicted dehydrogenase
MDKPASGTLEEYKAVLDTAKEKNLVVQLGYMYRYNPAVQKCMELIREGKLGEIYSINAEMSTFHSPAYKKWLQNKSLQKKSNNNPNVPDGRLS